jgi:insecticidal toxin complex protein TccC
VSWKPLAKTFKDGDILYGLDEGRGEAKNAILARDRGGKLTRIFAAFKKKRSERIIIQNTITDSVFHPGLPGLRSPAEVRAEPKVAADPERAVAFRDFLAAHPKYSLAQYQPPKNLMTDQSPMIAAWLKTSKAGLEFQATQRPGSKIHFVLDGLDFKRALATKDVAGDVARREMNAPLDITSGEVRWLFRHRNDPEVKDSVVFWHQGKQTPPPWEWPEHREGFANFLAGKSPDLAKEEGSGELKDTLQTLKASVNVQRAFRAGKGTHYVREGDSLQAIADQHSVSPADLRTWNGLASDAIAPGQVLRTRGP